MSLADKHVEKPKIRPREYIKTVSYTHLRAHET